MKVIGNIPKTLITAAEKSGLITEIHDEGYIAGYDSDYPHDYHLDIKNGYNWDDCGSIHENTVKKAISAIKYIKPDLPE